MNSVSAYEAIKPVKAERNTKQKDTIRKVFERMRNHPTADMIYEAVIKEDAAIGRATVYRVLNSYVRNGTALKIPVYDGADRFDITLYPHSHAKCRCCGAVEDVVSSAELPLVDDSKGFVIEGGAVLYYGLCFECKNK